MSSALRKRCLAYLSVRDVGILYRLGQFWHILRSEPLPHPILEEISALLSDREMALFLRLAPHDQWHGYRVLSTLTEAGHNHPSLQAAALLHDVGKTAYPPSIWERSFVVLVQALLPGRVTTWGQGEPKGWKRAFVVKARHADWGSQLARDAGSVDTTVRLIQRHQDEVVNQGTSDEDEMLLKLQWADDLN